MYFQDAHLVHFKRKCKNDVTIVWVSKERWLIVQMTRIFLLYYVIAEKQLHTLYFLFPSNANRSSARLVPSLAGTRHYKVD